MRPRDDDSNPIPIIISFLKTQVHGASIREIAQNMNINRNLVAKYLSILHMQGRLDLRSYGNIKIYRLSNKIPFQSLSLFTEEIILGIDKSLCIRSCHGCKETIFDLKIGQVLGKHIFESPNHSIFCSDLQFQIRSILDGTLTSTPEIECNIRGFHVRVRFIPCIFEDGHSGVAFLCSEIQMTKEQFSEFNLLSSRYSSLLQEMREFYIALSPEWEVLSINSALSQYCGKSPDDYIGTRGIPQVCSDDIDLIHQYIKSAESGVTEKCSVRVVLEDGSIRWQDWIFVIHSFDGRILGYHGYGWDISDRKLDESRIEMYQSGVEVLLHQKTEELREITSQLRREIDERRILERELKYKTERYQNLTELISDIIWEINPDNKFSFINGRVNSLCGYVPEEIIGKSLEICIHPEEYQHINDLFLRAKTQQTPIETTRVQILHKNGEYIWVEISGMPIFSQDGSFQGYQGICRDIAAKIAEEQALAHAYTINRTLIEVSPDPLVTIGPDGKITDVNKATVIATGLLRDQLIGTNFHLYFTNPEKADEGYQQVFSMGFVKDYPLEMIHTSGRTISVLYSAVLYRDQQGVVQGVFAAARDISQQIKAERKLKQAYAYTRTLIEVTPDPLVTIGPDGKITDVNKATEKATGYPREYLIGTNFNLYFTDPAKAEAGYEKVFSEGVVRDYPLEMLHKNGKSLSVLYSAVVFRDDKGKVQGVFAAARDVTGIRLCQNSELKSPSIGNTS
jgi:PAS domain S-box-containing protein